MTSWSRTVMTAGEGAVPGDPTDDIAADPGGSRGPGQMNPLVGKGVDPLPRGPAGASPGTIPSRRSRPSGTSPSGAQSTTPNCARGGRRTTGPRGRGGRSGARGG